MCRVCAKAAKRREKVTNPASKGVVDIKACYGADAGPCRHGHYKEEKELRTWRGKGEEGGEGIYRA